MNNTFIKSAMDRLGRIRLIYQDIEVAKEISRELRKAYRLGVKDAILKEVVEVKR